MCMLPFSQRHICMCMLPFSQRHICMCMLSFSHKHDACIQTICVVFACYILHIHATCIHTHIHMHTYTHACIQMALFNGCQKCCVCKKFVSQDTDICKACGQQCHDKCRQNICCRPCNMCWSSTSRSCVCGKSMRSLGVFRPLSANQPPTKRKKLIHETTSSTTTSTSTLTPTCETPPGKENVRDTSSTHAL